MAFLCGGIALFSMATFLFAQNVCSLFFLRFSQLSPAHSSVSVPLIFYTYLFLPAVFSNLIAY